MRYKKEIKELLTYFSNKELVIDNESLNNNSLLCNYMSSYINDYIESPFSGFVFEELPELKKMLQNTAESFLEKSKSLKEQTDSYYKFHSKYYVVKDFYYNLLVRNANDNIVDAKVFFEFINSLYEGYKFA